MHFAILIRKGFLGGAGFQGSNSWKTGMLELWKSILAEGGVWITAVSGRVAGRGFESKHLQPASCGRPDRHRHDQEEEYSGQFGERVVANAVAN